MLELKNRLLRGRMRPLVGLLIRQLEPERSWLKTPPRNTPPHSMCWITSPPTILIKTHHSANIFSNGADGPHGNAGLGLEKPH